MSNRIPPRHLSGRDTTAGGTPEAPVAVAPSTIGGLSLLGLGFKGLRRLGQTVGAVYPRALRWLYARRRPTPAELRDLFEALGTTYIKFGQFIASSPSIFPREYVEEFQSCLDQTPPVSFTVIRRIIEKELGRPLQEVFSFVDRKPLASASIAQVHAATLRSGEGVVVKVQKPGVESIVTTDMNAVYLLGRVLELVLPGLDRESITGIVAEMYQAMLDECDFEREAANMVAFQRFLDRSGAQDVLVPRPFPAASGRRVLTMERFYGTPLTDPSVLAQYGDRAAEQLFNALNVWFASLTGCDFFHADLHSGNVMLLEDGKVGFIDFGLVGRIPPGVWTAMLDFFRAVGEQDYELMAQSMLGIGMTRSTIDTTALSRDIRRMFVELEQLHTASGRDAEQHIAGLTTGLGEIGRRYGIRFPRAFTLLLKQFLYFDRYLQLLAPGASLFGDERLDIDWR